MLYGNNKNVRLTENHEKLCCNKDIFKKMCQSMEIMKIVLLALQGNN